MSNSPARSPATATLPLHHQDATATFEHTAELSTFSPGPPPETEPIPAPGYELAGRYILESALGEGGFGSVWLARIKGSEERVAIKLVTALSAQSLATARREVAALRWAQLPGVVRLLDDGSEGADYFIVMARVEGVPFPGTAGPQPWSAIEAPARQLLEILARLHLTGLIHRDLKPGNILVDALGRPTVIDLGIASGSALQRSLAGAYTPAYAAPEQILGQDCDARTDLYAVGAMLFEILTGRLPHSPSLLQRIQDPPPSVCSLAPQVPAAVGAVIDRLLSPRLADRPESALAVLRALGGQLPLLQGGGGLSLPATPQSAEALRALFHGPDHFLHLRQDAADELWARTEGQPAAVEAELGAWLRAGLGHWEDGAVRIDRVAIERLQSGLRLSLAGPGLPEHPDEAAVLGYIELAWPAVDLDLIRRAAPLPVERLDAAIAGLIASGRVWLRPDGRLSCRVRVQPAAEWSQQTRRAAHARLAEHSAPAARLRHLIAADADAAILLHEARQLVQRRIEDGALHRVLSALDLGLTLARRLQDRDAEIELLGLWAKWVLAQDYRSAINRALYEIERTAPVPRSLEPVHELLKAYQYALDRQGSRALELLARIHPFADERLEIWRVTARVAATRRLRSGAEAAEEALLCELEDWARHGSDERRGKLFGWRGNQKYGLGNYREAAQLHQEAAALKGERFAQVSSLMNSASALLEAQELEAVQKQAEQLTLAARGLRHAPFEAMACWIARTASYRLGQHHPPEPALVEAAAHISSYTQGLLAMCEASLAWRVGDHALARDLARSAREAFPQPAQKTLLRALELAAGAVPQPGELDALLGQTSLPDDFTIQIIGLLRRVTDRPGLADAAAAVAARFPEAQRSRCLDILSINECLHPHPPGDRREV